MKKEIETCTHKDIKWIIILGILLFVAVLVCEVIIPEQNLTYFCKSNGMKHEFNTFSCYKIINNEVIIYRTKFVDGSYKFIKERK